MFFVGAKIKTCMIDLFSVVFPVAVCTAAVVMLGVLSMVAANDRKKKLARSGMSIRRAFEDAHGDMGTDSVLRGVITYTMRRAKEVMFSRMHDELEDMHTKHVYADMDACSCTRTIHACVTGTALTREYSAFMVESAYGHMVDDIVATNGHCVKNDDHIV